MMIFPYLLSALGPLVPAVQEPGDVVDLSERPRRAPAVRSEDVPFAVSPSLAPRVLGRDLLFAISEYAQGGLDLNGDGDVSDEVVAYHRLFTDETVVLPFAGVPGHFHAGRVFLWVSEQSQGASDLNGDGDDQDQVAFVYDLGTASATDLGLAVVGSAADGATVAMQVSEVRQGSDLDGDGDLFDIVLHVLDLSSGDPPTNLGLAIRTDMCVSGHRFYFRVYESGQGDLNGDGDTFDEVLHSYDAQTGQLVNLGVQAQFGSMVAGEGFLAFATREGAQGSADLNGDGDTLDYVLQVLDTSTSSVTCSGLAVVLSTNRPSVLPLRNGFAFPVPETGQGATDLNGDGDVADGVMHVFDPVTRVATNLGFATVFTGPYSDFFDADADGDLVAFVTSEPLQGGADLNGDGDAIDTLLYLHDRVSSATTQIACSPLDVQVDAGRVAFAVIEYGAGTDLNGDGDVDDWVLHVHDADTGSTRNLERATPSGSTGFRLQDGLLGFLVGEPYQGNADLNGDGDALDRVLHFLDPRTGTLVNTRSTSLYTGPFFRDGQVYAFVEEAHEGATDLNDDGDADDRILRFFRVRL